MSRQIRMRSLPPGAIHACLKAARQETRHVA
jgi:hypothetical protein